METSFRNLAVQRSTQTLVGPLLCCGCHMLGWIFLPGTPSSSEGMKAIKVAVMCGVAQKDIRFLIGSIIALVRLETCMDPVHCLGATD
jgi:hypothetical protein